MTTLGKTKEECRQKLQSLSDRMFEAFDLVQPVDGPGLKLIDSEKQREAFRMTKGIIAVLEDISAEQNHPDYDELASDAESMVFHQEVDGPLIHFNLDLLKEQNIDWRHALDNARVNITWALGQLGHF